MIMILPSFVRIWAISNKSEQLHEFGGQNSATILAGKSSRNQCETGARAPRSIAAFAGSTPRSDDTSAPLQAHSLSISDSALAGWW